MDKTSECHDHHVDPNIPIIFFHYDRYLAVSTVTFDVTVFNVLTHVVTTALVAHSIVVSALVLHHISVFRPPLKVERSKPVPWLCPLAPVAEGLSDCISVVATQGASRQS